MNSFRNQLEAKGDIVAHCGVYYISSFDDLHRYDPIKKSLQSESSEVNNEIVML